LWHSELSTWDIMFFLGILKELISE